MSEEKCPKCGSTAFGVARNMRGDRSCGCGATWIPGSINELLIKKLQAENARLSKMVTDKAIREMRDLDEIESLKNENAKLKEKLSVACEALEQYGNKNNWRYSANNDVGAFDAWLDFKQDHACKTTNELGGFTARQALAKIKLETK